MLSRAARGSCALVGTPALAAAFAASAPAVVYCADQSSTAGCDHVESPGGNAGLAAAFAAANGDAAADTIEVGAGAYTGPFDATAGGGALTVIYKLKLTAKNASGEATPDAITFTIVTR